MLTRRWFVTMVAMARRHLTFSGGIELADEKHFTLHSAITPAAMPRRLAVPLMPFGPQGPQTQLSVDIGSKVRAGDVIATIHAQDLPASDEASQEMAAAPRDVGVRAPLDGIVAGLVTAKIAASDGFAVVPAVEMIELSAPASFGPAQADFDWSNSLPQELRQRITAAGLVVHGPRLQSLALYLAGAIEHKCSVLIANVMECQPYVTADHRLLVEYGGAVVRGLAILAKAVGAKQTILAVDHRRVGEYRSLLRPAQEHGIERLALAHKYPIGLDRMLAGVLTGREVPPGGSALDVGAAVVNAATCLAVFRQVACGLPALGRVVTISGPRIPKPANVWAPLGMPIRELAGVDGPLVHGGPMVGLSCGDDAVVTPATDAVLALEPGKTQPPGACIRCGWCSDHCPARLNVSALNDMYELGQVDRASKAGVAACLECGVCSYVCPAYLPMMQRIKQLKQAVSRQ